MATLTVDEISVKLRASLAGTSGLFSAITAPVDFSQSWSLTSGTAANQADKIYTTTVTLAGSATSNIDLAGSLTDALGAALTFAKVKFIIIYASASNNASNAMQVTSPDSTGFQLFMDANGLGVRGISLAAGQIFMWGGPLANGISVAAGTADILTFTNSAGTNTISAQVIVVGTSA